MDVVRYITHRRRIVDRALKTYVARLSPASPLLSHAIRYSLFPGGKRFRPILVLASAEAVNGSTRDVLPVACAMEFIHTYSLIHDDLPAMDNDDMRREKPSSHIAFGEGVAILTGDVLLTEAFHIVSGAPIRRGKKDIAREIVNEIAASAGSHGMVGGQICEMTEKRNGLGRAALERIYSLKTGSLIRASVVCGALASGARSRQVSALSCYGEALGLAFQISDDILDEEKTRDKGYSSLYGRNAARTRVKELENKAVSALSRFGGSADPLRALAGVVSRRTS